MRVALVNISRVIRMVNMVSNEAQVEGQRGATRTHPNEDSLALDVDVGDGKLVRQRHVGGT